MKVMFDTNVILDVLLECPPFSEPAAKLLSRAERGEIQGFVCATTITTIFYLARKAVARTHAGRSETCSRFWTSLRSIVPYWRAPLKARSATSRMPLSSSPRGRCRPRPFSLVTREILRGLRFPFTPRARCRPSLIRASRVESMPEAQSSSWRRCRSRFGVGERADTQAGSPSIRAGTMGPKAQQSPFISGKA